MRWFPICDLDVTGSVDWLMSMAVRGQPSESVLPAAFWIVVVKRNCAILPDDKRVDDWPLIAHDVLSPHCSVTLNEVTAMVSPAVIVVVFRFMSAPEVATFPWKMTVGVVVRTRK